MARTAKRSQSAARSAAKGGAATSAPKVRAIRPVLLAAGLGLYWFVENPDSGAVDVPMWGYVTLQGVRVLVDFVGAWFVVSALQLVVALGRFGVTYARALWAQEG